MAMTPWIREEAWALLQGSVWWGADRQWAPLECYCEFCWRMRSVKVEETGVHFVEYPRFDLLWRQSS
eukprot:SAG22_NODE_1697_length_3790_cov_1.813601_6_plen_67_part_00